MASRGDFVPLLGNQSVEAACSSHWEGLGLPKVSNASSATATPIITQARTLAFGAFLSSLKLLETFGSATYNFLSELAPFAQPLLYVFTISMVCWAVYVAAKKCWDGESEGSSDRGNKQPPSPALSSTSEPLRSDAPCWFDHQLSGKSNKSNKSASSNNIDYRRRTSSTDSWKPRFVEKDLLGGGAGVAGAGGARADSDSDADSEDDASVSLLREGSHDMSQQIKDTAAISRLNAGILESGEGGSYGHGACLNQSVLGDLDGDCLRFLLSKQRTLSLAPGQVLFRKKAARDGFLVVKSGQVVVDSNRRSDQSEEHVLQAGETIVGMLFVLASLPLVKVAGDEAPEVCRLHNSTAWAGASGAEVVCLPLSAFSEAFDRFPQEMVSMVRRLCVRHSLVVFETLSRYFNLNSETLTPSKYRAVDLKALIQSPRRDSPPSSASPSSAAAATASSTTTTPTSPERRASRSSAPSAQKIFSQMLSEGDRQRPEVQDLLASSVTLEVQKGQQPLSLKQRPTHLLVLIEGDLWMSRPVKTDGSSSVANAIATNNNGLNNSSNNNIASNNSSSKAKNRAKAKSFQVVPGECIGELSILIDRASPVVLECRSHCKFAALPRDDAQKLFELCPRTWTLRLLHSLAGRSANWLHRVDAALDWLPVEGGQCLYRKGDMQVGFFVVLSGRLSVLEEGSCEGSTKAKGSKNQHGGNHRDAACTQWQVVDSIPRGRVCGEADCLSRSHYSQTLRAARDSEVCRVSPTVLDLIAADFPKAILHFSSHVGLRPPKGEGEGGWARRKATIAVVPADASVDISDVCNRLTAALNVLGKTVHLSSQTPLVASLSQLQRTMATSSNSSLAAAAVGAAAAGSGRVAGAAGVLGEGGGEGGGVAAEGGAGSSSSSSGVKLDDTRLRRHLAELEERYHWLVYEAEPVDAEGRVTDWTRRCVRQADHILVAVNFDGTGRGHVPEGENERYINRAGLHHVQRDLLLLHAPNAAGTESKDDFFASEERLPPEEQLGASVRSFLARHSRSLFGKRSNEALRSTRHYLSPRPWARRWHHVRNSEACDWARCARLLAGRGVGLCLGGGGARGNCHFGVIQALEEMGIPVDVVSGTSFGALAGAMYCESAPKKGSLKRYVQRVMGSTFSQTKMMLDLNFPRTAYFSGAFLNCVLKQTFGKRRCEDLLVPFACTSTDIVAFQSKLHHEGPLWRICRASMSLVGFVPPLPFAEKRSADGHVTETLLVDGGYSNQYPIEVLKEHGAGTVICVVACADFDSVNTSYGDSVNGGAISLGRFFGCRRRVPKDPLTQAEIQERLMFLVENMKDHNTARSDITICPEIQKYGLLEFANYQEITSVGYKAAVPALKTWLEEESTGAQRARQVLEQNLELQRAAEEKASSKVDRHRRCYDNPTRTAARRAADLVRASGACLDGALRGRRTTLWEGPLCRPQRSRSGEA